MPDAIDRFFATYDGEIEKLAQDLRAKVRKLVPDTEESLKLGWKAVLYGKTCAILPHRSTVNLQFPGGASLEDPDGLLEGTGKNMRHVKVRKPADIKSGALTRLIKQAARLDS